MPDPRLYAYTTMTSVTSLLALTQIRSEEEFWHELSLPYLREPILRFCLGVYGNVYKLERRGGALEKVGDDSFITYASHDRALALVARLVEDEVSAKSLYWPRTLSTRWARVEDAKNGLSVEEHLLCLAADLTVALTAHERGCFNGEEGRKRVIKVMRSWSEHKCRIFVGVRFALFVMRQLEDDRGWEGELAKRVGLSEEGVQGEDEIMMEETPSAEAHKEVAVVPPPNTNENAPTAVGEDDDVMGDARPLERPRCSSRSSKHGRRTADVIPDSEDEPDDLLTELDSADEVASTRPLPPTASSEGVCRVSKTSVDAKPVPNEATQPNPRIKTVPADIVRRLASLAAWFADAVAEIEEQKQTAQPDQPRNIMPELVGTCSDEFPRSKIPTRQSFFQQPTSFDKYSSPVRRSMPGSGRLVDYPDSDDD